MSRSHPAGGGPNDPRQSTPSHPPSEPRPDKSGNKDLLGGGYDRPARLQMIVALVLGLVLVAIPLYLWRRPRAESPVVAAEDAQAAPLASLADAQAAEDAGGPLALGEPKLIECHDPGPKKTPPEQCDRLADFEKAFARAIQDAASCSPTSAGSGALPYVADVSFGRKKQPVHVSVAKEGRTLKSAKALAACTAAVKKNIGAFNLDGVKHDHMRYKIGIVANYSGR